LFVKKVTRLKRVTSCNFVTLLTFHILLIFLRTDDEMDHAVRRGNEEAVEIFA